MLVPYIFPCPIFNLQRFGKQLGQVGDISQFHWSPMIVAAPILAEFGHPQIYRSGCDLALLLTVMIIGQYSTQYVGDYIFLKTYINHPIEESLSPTSISCNDLEGVGGILNTAQMKKNMEFPNIVGYIKLYYHNIPIICPLHPYYITTEYHRNHRFHISFLASEAFNLLVVYLIALSYSLHNFSYLPRSIPKSSIHWQGFIYHL